ncbi:MAG: hypothetical protein JWP97_2267 [Labilithrix sp.]|nr:hypothetical protein [Labilithrix sp.]
MGTQNLKAKRVATSGGDRTASSSAAAVRVSRASRPSVARAEVVDKTTRARFEAELDAALKRKPASEVKLAGALRAVATLSPALRGSLVEATQLMIRRGSFTREIYTACLRTLAETDDRNVATLLKAALAGEDAGGNATLSAASFSRDPSLAPVLAKLAASRQSHLAFGAETARVCRRESNGAHLTAIAPMIKESHRIALCVELFVPLARSAPVSGHIAPALAVLRGAERHLGRWLVLADVATKSGDHGPLSEALSKAQVGPTSARSAWSLVVWALTDTRAAAQNLLGAVPAVPGPPPPTTRPTVELVARLSDRPSADRDTTFLFRMARARALSCKPMLEGLLKGSAAIGDRAGAPISQDGLVPVAPDASLAPAAQAPVAQVAPAAQASDARALLSDEIAVRAASYLVRDHGRADLLEALLDCAENAKRDELRGLAVAALWDTGDAGARVRARELADDLVTARSHCISSVAWGTLVRAAHGGGIGKGDAGFVVASETAFRWIHHGWLE